jgi:hypothetical protein
MKKHEQYATEGEPMLVPFQYHIINNSNMADIKASVVGRALDALTLEASECIFVLVETNCAEMVNREA